MLLSFMGESRRLDNQRLKRELRVRLRYPTVLEGLALKSPPAASATASGLAVSAPRF
mgnify:CR=1 FL=1